MMEEVKKNLYKILYTDTTYLMIEWTEEEFIKVANAKVNGQEAVATKDSLVDLNLVRTIVLVPPITEPTEEETKEYNSKMKQRTKTMMTEWGFVDQETMNWLESQGIMSMDELDRED